MSEQKGNVLTINTGSVTTKLGYFVDGKKIFEQKLHHPADEVAKYPDVMQQDGMRRDAVREFLRSKGIHACGIDIIMGRGGLFKPVGTGVYRVNSDMRDVLMSCRDGKHACNLSAIIADDLAEEINEKNRDRGYTPAFGPCHAYIADPPLADEMPPECRIGGLPEFPRTSLFHALNSRAAVRHYLGFIGHERNDITVIVAHMGGGVTVSLHRNGRVIDTNDGLGGDGPFTPERAGSCSPYGLVDLCFSGEYSRDEIRKKLVGRGGAVAFFGTNDLAELQRRADAGSHREAVWLKAFALNVSKYITSEAAVVEGKVDAILLTGGTAYDTAVTGAITQRVSFLAPVKVYPGEFELDSLAENAYDILAGKADIHLYDKDAPLPDPFGEV